MRQMNRHYPRDTGILAALDYLDMGVDPVPMLKRVKRAGKPVCKPATGRLLAVWWMICTAIKP